MASKTHKEENFPVASWLIRKELRPHIMAYYDFARTADDIADNPEMSPEKKIILLDDLEAVLGGIKPASEATKSAEKLKESLSKTGVNPERATDLLKAFRMDAKGETYHSWLELMNYCKYSAAPVGRYVLDLHKESTATYWPSDMLCSALQILNHLQDCQKDLKEMERAYIPLNFMQNQGISYDELLKSNITEKLQSVITLMLDQTEGLLKEASTLPLITLNRGLRMEIVTIHALAQRLLYRLRTQDMLASRVKLRKTDWIKAFYSGITRGIWRKQIMMLKK